jgi:hypothetical protein
MWAQGKRLQNVPLAGLFDGESKNGGLFFSTKLSML